MPFRYYLYILFLAIPLFFFAAVLLIWFWVPVLFIAPLIIMILFFIKVRRQRMVLVLIQSALETGTPIHEMLESYASSCWGPWYREKVLRFADNIRAGHSIAAAAVASRGVLRYDAVGLIRLGGNSEQIGGLLAQTVDETRRSGHIQLQSIFRLSWFCGYIPFLILLPGFYMIWIMPKMEMIFRDFDAQLPAITLFVIGLSKLFIHYVFLFAPVVCFFAFLPFIYFVVRSGIFPWRPPGARHLLRQIDAAYFLRILATGLEMKKSIPEIVETYSFVVPSYYLRYLTRQFSNRVEKGNDWIASLAKIRWLSKNEAALSEAAVKLGNLPQMLREIAAGKEQSQITSDNAIGRGFFLLFVLAIGALVALFAVAFFMPLVQLINNLVFY